MVHVNRLRHRFQQDGILEAGTSNSTSHQQYWQAPQIDHLLLEVTTHPGNIELARVEGASVQLLEQPEIHNHMLDLNAEPELPAPEQNRPAESFGARYPT